MITDPLNRTATSIPTVTGEIRLKSQRQVGPLSLGIKRVLDILIASVALIALSPVIVLAAASIIASSPGSPFFTQQRYGLGGRVFKILKLRTMAVGSHVNQQALLVKEKADSRIFPVGRILRKLSLDELTNFVNVLTGEMSVVGPRPMPEYEMELCRERLGSTTAMERLAVKPGITGLWQISGRANLTFDQRVALDLQYAETWTIWGDIIILLKTVPAVLSARGAF